MRKEALAALGTVLVAATFGYAKTKVALPAYVLQAHTIAVIIDPDAGMSIEDPQANRVAQKDVETALQSWGRFSLTTGPQGADLIVVVRRGHDRVVDQTITDPRQNNRPGVITSTDNSVMVGGQRGRQPDMSSDQGTSLPTHSQTEIGQTEDVFSVFRNDAKDPLQESPAWRYMAKDGLRPHAVPAVAEFKKAVGDAEKAAAKKP